LTETVRLPVFGEPAVFSVTARRADLHWALVAVAPTDSSRRMPRVAL
jgi:uncharacterized protein (DUF2126 family)